MTPTIFQASAPQPPCGGSSATRRHASSGSCGGGKTACGTCGTVHRSFYDHKVRRSEYHRVSGKGRAYIKGQRYTLLSHRQNLTLDGRRLLKKLLAANRRMNTAYLLKESFAQLWDYRREAWARKFFDRWKESLKWQRLGPLEKFAAMVERNWDGVVAYCRLEEKIPLGFVEGMNNKIRVIQRRAYGLRDEEYLRLKVLTCMLPEI